VREAIRTEELVYTQLLLTPPTGAAAAASPSPAGTAAPIAAIKTKTAAGEGLSAPLLGGGGSDDKNFNNDLEKAQPEPEPEPSSAAAASSLATSAAAPPAQRADTALGEGKKLLSDAATTVGSVAHGVCAKRSTDGSSFPLSEKRSFVPRQARDKRRSERLSRRPYRMFSQRVLTISAA
jgi:hypothetical protein